MKLSTGRLVAENEAPVPQHGPCVALSTPAAHLTLQQNSARWCHLSAPGCLVPVVLSCLLGSALSHHPVRAATASPVCESDSTLRPTETRQRAADGRCLAEPHALILLSPGAAVPGKAVWGVTGSPEVKDSSNRTCVDLWGTQSDENKENLPTVTLAEAQSKQGNSRQK